MFKNRMLTGTIAAVSLIALGNAARAETLGGASCQGYVIGPSTKLQVYAVMGTYNGGYSGSALIKGFMDFKGVSNRTILGNPTFAPILDGNGIVIGNRCTASGAAVWNGILSTMKFTWFDYNGVSWGDVWWEIRSNATGALLFGSGIDWPTDFGSDVYLPSVKVTMPQ